MWKCKYKQNDIQSNDNYMSLFYLISSDHPVHVFFFMEIKLRFNAVIIWAKNGTVDIERVVITLREHHNERANFTLEIVEKTEFSHTNHLSHWTLIYTCVDFYLPFNLLFAICL